MAANNPQSAFDFYNENFGHYIKTVAVEKSSHGITGALTNGSGFYFWRNEYYNDGGSSNVYLMFCPYYKDCKELAKKSWGFSEVISDGKRYFGFYCDGLPPKRDVKNRKLLLKQCQGNEKGLCTTLIWFDGWEIKDDYPIKL